MINLDQPELFGDQRVRPGAIAPIVIADESGSGITAVEMHWGLRPRPRGKPWHNVRAEGKQFPVKERCLVTAGEYYINVKQGPNRGRWAVRWPGDADLCL